MRQQINAIAAILFSTVIFLMGNGLLGTLTPVRAHLAGFPDLVIGVIGSAYFAGFVIGCFVGPRWLAQVGHVRTFAVAGGLAAATTLLQSLAVNEFAWILARGLFGFAAANVYMVLESWLNDRATNDTRGRIFSAYLTVNFAGLIAGQFLFTTGKASSFGLFNLSAIFYALCLIPVGLTSLPQPKPAGKLKLRPLHVFRIAPVGVAGCIAVGLANAAIWTLAPVYAQDHGLTRGMLAAFMAAFTVGGALIQMPLGRLSDRMDRRHIIAAIAIAAATAGIMLATFGGRSREAALALVAIYGAMTLPLYGLAVAHANDRLPRDAFVETSATLLLANALASVVGPTLAAIVIAFAGTASLFYYTAAVHLVLAIFVIIRIRIMEAPGHETREPFSPLPQQASPVSVELDPRGTEVAVG